MLCSILGSSLAVPYAPTVEWRRAGVNDLLHGSVVTNSRESVEQESTLDLQQRGDPLDMDFRNTQGGDARIARQPNGCQQRCG